MDGQLTIEEMKTILGEESAAYFMENMDQYGDQIEDKSTLAKMVGTNKAQGREWDEKRRPGSGPQQLK